MTKGWYFDEDGVPLYFGESANKPALSGRTFVAESAAGPRPSDLHGWDGQGWAPNGTLQARAEKDKARGTLWHLDRLVPRGLEDLIDLLEARGLVDRNDLPAETTDTLAAKAAARAKLA
jgi:hypothetical protein